MVKQWHGVSDLTEERRQRRIQLPIHVSNALGNALVHLNQTPKLGDRTLTA